MTTRTILTIVRDSVIGLTLIAFLLFWSWGDQIEYFYFDFADARVAEADWQKPDIWLYIGDKVPLKTTIDWNGEALHFLNVKTCCVPHLEIHSPVPLSNVIVAGTIYGEDGHGQEFETDFHEPLGCVSSFRRDENTVRLSWTYWPESTGLSSCIRVGDEISIKFVPENGSEPLTVSAILVRSGHYWK
jgi:hypothetical protein